MTAPPKTAILYRMVMPDHVCPYGRKSLWLLRRKGYSGDDRHLTTRGAGDADDDVELKQGHAFA